MDSGQYERAVMAIVELTGKLPADEAAEKWFANGNLIP